MLKNTTFLFLLLRNIRKSLMKERIEDGKDIYTKGDMILSESFCFRVSGTGPTENF